MIRFIVKFYLYLIFSSFTSLFWQNSENDLILRDLFVKYHSTDIRKSSIFSNIEDNTTIQP